MAPKNIIQYSDYRKRVMGCWMGKAIGGTLGMPHEGKPGPLALTFYDPVPMGAIPNDDLDLQVLWLMLVKRYGTGINPRQMGQGWLDHVDFPWDEYGAAWSNFSRGIFAPAGGHHSNFCGDCMGSPIRSEIWGCLAPGDPELAGKLALADGIQDHDGEGIWGELFFATIESAAFVLHDRDQLIELGLSALPKDCRVAKAVRATVNWYCKDQDWKVVREMVMREFGHINFTDAPQNIAFTILGWLAGKDFGDALCTAVNCGQDTDCTAATLGSILGIIDPDGIPAKWKAPISQELILSFAIKNLNYPKTLDDLTDLTAQMAEKMLADKSQRTTLTHNTKAGTTNISLPKIKPMPWPDLNSILLADGDLKITVSYPRGLDFVPGKNIPVCLKFANQTKKAISAELDLQLPSGWTIEKGKLDHLKLPAGKAKDFSLEVKVPKEVRVYSDYATLGIQTSGLRAEYRLPFVMAWPWKVTVNGKGKIVWQPERVLLPMKGIKVHPGDIFKASTSIHFARKQFVRIVLASNGAGKVKVDGQKVLEYEEGQFIPFPHRPPEQIFHDMVFQGGLHHIEVELQFDCPNPQAALVFGDGDYYHLIHDLTPQVLE
jgi:ADP-ribosylglycohydrolase